MLDSPSAGAAGADIDGDIGAELYELAKAIFPICRSITGQGVRDTLAILGRHLPLEQRDVPTGTPLFDWIVPKEWAIRDAFILDPTGRKVVDFHRSNLCVLNYSTPIDDTMTLAELKPHVFTLPEQPDLVPFRTSCYAERWGF